MREKTKNEHYVPKFYLLRWKNEKGKVWAYDKTQKKQWPSSIDDIACKRYFYDIDYQELTDKKIELLRKLGIEPTQDEQFIEHFFSDHIEGIYSKVLKKILDIEITAWHEKECYFLSKQCKIDMSLCISFQYIRTVETRRALKDMSSCLEQAFREMNITEDVLEKYTIKKGDEKIIHGNMVLDMESICDIASSFNNLTWILGVNKTSVDFYTSDNPIGTIPHIKNDIISMSGIRSKGVEVFFPLSPKHILIMYDGSYHTYIKPYDRKYISIDEEEWVEEYNKRSVYNSNRCIYSQSGDFSIIDEIRKNNPESLNVPKTELLWNGKVFFPNN